MKGLGRNVLSLAGGNITAQAISLLAVPILTRLYTTDEFGVFSAYIAVVMILVPISTLRFNSALLVAESEVHANNLLILSILSVVGISILVTIVSSLFFVFDTGGVLQPYLWLIPVAVLMLGAVQSIQFWLLRLKHFNTIAVAQVSESISDRGIAIGMGLSTGAGAFGLIAGRILGPMVNTIYMCIHLSRYSFWPSFKSINRGSMWNSVCRYRDFPLFSSWAFFANSAAREAPVLILAVLFGPAVAGLYGLGLRVLNMPMLVIGDALSKALLARMREHRDEVRILSAALMKIFALVSYMGMLLMLIMIGVGENLFSYVFGNEWREAGEYAAVLSPAIMLMLGYRITSVLFDLYERQKQRMLFDVGLLIVRISSLTVAAGLDLTVLKALLLMMVLTSVLYGVGIVYLFSLVRISPLHVFHRIGRNILLLSPSIVCILLLGYFSIAAHSLLIALVFMTILQAIIVFLFDRRLFVSSTNT